ncbi:MAG: glycoside hydrolase family protein [Bacteroides sp.]|nr:glycoside hydrolase family protein [Bacteroides sp.]
MEKLFRFIFLFFLPVCPSKPASAQVLAFPIAEGYDKYTSGGRGGKVIIVTNLNDSGDGSLRHGIARNEPRTIVFAIDGTIELQSKLINEKDNITIAGQSAPGDGICLKSYPLYIRANNVIIRYIRSRMGDSCEMEKVLNYAGYNHHRGSYDKGVVHELRTDTTKGGETYGGGNKGITNSQNLAGGWPVLKQGKYLQDSDRDGMPDAWNFEYGLNPNDSVYGNLYNLHKHYTNIEIYLKSLLSSEKYFSVLKKETDQTVINKYLQESISAFSKKLKPVGRILETEGYYVWCCAPIYGEDGRVHVFYSRWPQKHGMGGWISKCEIAHAVADVPEGPYAYVETILKPRPGYFDATTCHNPHIQCLNGTYYLFYMGNSDGSVYTKRIGLAKSQSLDGPWERSDKPIFEAGKSGAWDDCNTTNPAFLFHPNGQAWLYYKSWNKQEYQNQKGTIRANRKYGLAVADNIEGEYNRYEGNPVVDFSVHGDNKQVEDAYVYIEDGKFKMLMRDMGYFDHEVGLIFESEDGIHWSEPQIAWFGAAAYLEEPPAPKHLKRYGRLERPQLLMRKGKPAYLFNAMQGGRYDTASGFVFKIIDNE